MKKLCLLLILCAALQLSAQNNNDSLRHLYNKFQNDKEGTSNSAIANSISHIYYEAGKFDSALYYGKLALQSAAKQAKPHEVYMAQFSVIASLIRLKKLDEVTKEFEAVHKRNVPPDDINFFIRYYTLLGNLHLAKKNTTAALAYYDTAQSYAGKALQPALHLYVYQNMADSYAELNDYKTAYQYYKKYNREMADMFAASGKRQADGPNSKEALQNEIQYLNKEKEIKELQLLQQQELQQYLKNETKLKDSLLRNEIKLRTETNRADSLHISQLESEKQLGALLKNKNELQAAKLNDEKNLRLSLLIGLSVALALAAIISFQYYRQRKKSAIIKKQAEELQTLLKEIHHRVKNNMQIVASLLDLQSFTIKDEGASEAVKESRNRVQSMALIHQNLYREGNIKSMPMEDYIQNLALNLFDSYNIEKDKVKLKTDIDPLHLDVDTVIPLGLIINELISNSLKYAFKGKEFGELAVALKEKNNELVLEVRDNGNGFPENWNNNNSHSFGYKLIKAFAQKLKAKLDVFNNDGACVCMHIARYKMA